MPATLEVGAPADVCVFDPDAWWKVERAALRSQGKNTPFLGLEVPGQVRCTIVAGQVVHESMPLNRRKALNEVVESHLRSLTGDRNVDRRTFVVTSLGAGLPPARHAGIRRRRSPPSPKASTRAR